MAHLHGLIAVLLSILGIVSVTGKGLLFKHTANNGDTEFNKTCDDCHEEVITTATYKVYGESYNKIFVGSNGYVTFGEGYDWYIPISNAFTDAIMVAPYWSDGYPTDPVKRSHIWYREETEDQQLLDKAQKVVRNRFGDCGYNFKPTALFIVTWAGMASVCEISSAEQDEHKYYDDGNDYDYDYKRSNSERSPQEAREEIQLELGSRAIDDVALNSYQLVLATDGCDTYAIFNIKTIEWTWCYENNQMMFNAGDGERFYIHPEYTSSGLVDDSNVNKNGRWAYKIDGKHVMGSDCKKAE